jgi:hypothetical protein
MSELPNKPLWSAAPPWANWLACDITGDWYWYADEPSFPTEGSRQGFWKSHNHEEPADDNCPFGNGKMEMAHCAPEGWHPLQGWDQSKEKRP